MGADWVSPVPGYFQMLESLALFALFAAGCRPWPASKVEAATFHGCRNRSGGMLAASILNAFALSGTGATTLIYSLSNRLLTP